MSAATLTDERESHTGRVTRFVAVVGGALTVVLAFAAGGFLVASGLDATRLADDATGGLVVWTAFGLVGAVVAAKRPANATGWLLLVVGLGLVANTFGTEYARYGIITNPGSLPAAQAGEWLHLAHLPSLVAIPLVLLTFPTGRPPSRRWWALVWWLAFTGTCYLAFLIWAFSMHDAGWIVTGQSVGDMPMGPAAQLVGAVGYFGTIAAFPAAAVALLLRFRRSRGDERQQLKWLAFAVVVMTATWPLAELNAAGWAASMVAVAGVPVAIGIAIVRYRLYEIDRVVSRTVSYVLLTLVLAGVYVAGVVVVGGVVRDLSGGAGGDLVVAATTLVIAALFQPARRRIQRLVDRRFNRARYDAQRTVETFSQRLRSEVDLQSLAGDLRLVVEETVRPRSVGLWLPEEAVR